MNRPEPKALYVLGRRIERLLLTGIALIFACLVELWLAQVSAQFASNRTSAALSAAATSLEGAAQKLTVLHSSQKPETPAEAVAKDKRDAEIAATRKKLGLPPEARKIESKPTYESRVREVVNKAVVDAGVTDSHLLAGLDFTQPPEQIIGRLREHAAQSAQKSAQVWGIELPRLVPLTYAGYEYHIPSEAIATAAIFGLGPLLIGWIGSVYLTRQRELLLIARAEDYKSAFPHILNLVPVNFQTINERLQGGARRRTGRGMAFYRYVLMAFRMLVLALYMGPMIYAFSMSGYSLWRAAGMPENVSYASLALMAVVTVIQAFGALNQEWIVIHGKEFIE